ncbi:HNH endonuclease signature motif containing protein [Flexivirga lutea]
MHSNSSAPASTFTSLPTEAITPAVAEPGRGPEVLALLQAAAAVLDEVPGIVHQLGADQEDELVSVLLRMHGRSAQLTTVVTADAAERCAVTESDAPNTSQWLSAHAADGPPVEPRTLRAMATVADACRARRNTVLAGALREGSCSVDSARTALAQADKVAPVIPTADRDEILGWFLQVDPALGTTGLTQLTRRIIARFAPERLSHDDEKLEATEALTWSTTPTGMTRLVAELSPANAAIVKDAINATSAPRPAAPGDGTASVRDERTPGKRRVDALMDLLAAGARTATGDGVQAGAATVLLTMGLRELLDGHGATTVDGDVLDAGAARRFACSADLIPAVLGGPSKPLDVGRRERLATKAIRAAVILRDRGCSFPGCDRPPGFCEVHHVRPWWAGGKTSLANSALLCCRHHQTVHRQGYTALVHPDRVEWCLTPGLLPGHQTTAA